MRRLLACFLALCVAGAGTACGSDVNSSGQQGSPTSASATHGYWYGTGPDNDQCFVVCENCAKRRLRTKVDTPNGRQGGASLAKRLANGAVARRKS
jgi:hypothetical protein